MKSASITISYDEEKLEAARLYMEQKKLNVERELENALEGMYQKHVPANVREFIEMRSQVEKPQKKKVQRGERAMLSLAEDMIK